MSVALYFHIIRAYAQACGDAQRSAFIWLSSHIEYVNTFAHFTCWNFFTSFGVPEWNAEREIRSFQRGGSLLQSLPSIKTVHRTVLIFTPLRAPDVFSGTLSPYPCDPFEKGSIENFPFLDKILKFAAQPHLNYSLLTLQYSPHLTACKQSFKCRRTLFEASSHSLK